MLYCCLSSRELQTNRMVYLISSHLLLSSRDVAFAICESTPHTREQQSVYMYQICCVALDRGTMNDILLFYPSDQFLTSFSAHKTSSLSAVCLSFAMFAAVRVD